MKASSTLRISAAFAFFIVILFFSNISFALTGKVISGDCQNGNGTYLYDNGDKYEGDWRDGERNGHGKYTWPNGDIYEGDWKDDKFTEFVEWKNSTFTKG